MRRLFFGIGIACALLFAGTASYTPVFADDSAPTQTCEQALQGAVTSITNATSWEEIVAAMETIGVSTRPDAFSTSFNNDLELARAKALAYLARAKCPE